jgi:hypothetical protein
MSSHWTVVGGQSTFCIDRKQAGFPLYISHDIAVVLPSETSPSKAGHFLISHCHESPADPCHLILSVLAGKTYLLVNN